MLLTLSTLTLLFAIPSIIIYVYIERERQREIEKVSERKLERE